MTDYKFPYEKLDVWQEAKALIIAIYGETAQFPTTEKYGLVSQINRAAVSVASNLAEGSGRTSLKDQAHFSQIAYSSLMEVSCQMVIACELEFVAEEKCQKIRQMISGIANKINALRNSQLKRAGK